MSAIHKRLHYAQKTEFKILKRVFGQFLPPQYPYQVQGASENVFNEDFDDSIDVIQADGASLWFLGKSSTVWYVWGTITASSTPTIADTLS